MKFLAAAATYYLFAGTGLRGLSLSFPWNFVQLGSMVCNDVLLIRREPHPELNLSRNNILTRGSQPKPRLEALEGSPTIRNSM